MLVVSPAVQLVPAASCCTTDQVPLAHCWKEVPPIQFHIPSVVQAVPAAMAEPDPLVPVLVPVLAGVEEDATGVEAIDATGAALETGATVAIVADEATGEAAAVADAAEDGATVTKTPPEAAGDEARTALEVTWEPACCAVDEPAAGPADAEAPATAFPQELPVGVARADEVAVPSCSTESPGLGNRRSVES